MKVVECIDVWKYYGDVIALQGVSFHVNRGEIYCVLGPNGSGKTTLLEGIVSLRRFDKGRVMLFGYEISSELPFEIAKRLGIIFEESQLLPWLTVEENIKYLGKLYGIELSRSDILHALELTGLDPSKRSKLYRCLSKGEKRKVEIAAVLALKPELAIMDEPTTGLDPDSRIEILEILSKLNRSENVTILFSTHILEDVEKIGDRILILLKGKKIAEGSLDDLISSFKIPWKIVITVPDKETIGEIRKILNDLSLDLEIRELSKHEHTILIEVEDDVKALHLAEILKTKMSNIRIRVIPPKLEEIFTKLVREVGKT